MAKQNDNTAPARDALAAWDKLFNERETLNGNLDCCNDAEYHQPEGEVPAETVQALATAAILLEQTNVLIEKAHAVPQLVNERQSRKAGSGKEPAKDSPEENTDTDDRVCELQIQLEQLAGVASIAAETCDDIALGGALNIIERELEAVREGLNDFLGLNGKAPAVLATFDAIQARCEAMPIDQAALELRRHNWDASENLSASPHEDGYTVTRTWTRKGLRYFLAERQFMESLLSGDE